MNNQSAQFSIKKKAVIYVRVSSEEQVENFSLKTQEDICRRDAIYKGYEVVEIFKEEGRSAKNITGRPTLIQMLDYCRKNKKELGAVIVYRLDRLSRQTEDFLAIKKKLVEYNIALISANEPTGNSPTEKLLETILASFAQHDNDVRSERTKNGMRARFLAGLVTNHVPYGYINQSGYAVKDPETFDLYKKAWDLMATGTKSLREMSIIMREWGLKVAGMQTVHHLFRNKFYMGILSSKSYPEEVRGQHTPMITEEQFYKVQAILDGRNNNQTLMPKYTRDNPDFPVRRIIRCGKCKTPFTGGWSKYHTNAYYFCRKRCDPRSIRVDDLDISMKALLDKHKPTEKGIRLYCAYLVREYNKQLAKINKIRSSADEEIKKLYAIRQTLIEKNLAGVYSDDIFKEQNAVLEEKMIAIQASKNDALVDKYDINAITAFIHKKISQPAITYSESTLSQIRCLLGSIFMSGLSWAYPGVSNDEISPIYQDIINAGSWDDKIGCGAGI